MKRWTKLDDALSPKPDTAAGETIRFEPSAELKTRVKTLMLEIVGEDETHWTDHFGLEHNVPTDGMRARNELRDQLREEIKEL